MCNLRLGINIQYSCGQYGKSNHKSGVQTKLYHFSDTFGTTECQFINMHVLVRNLTLFVTYYSFAAVLYILEY